MSFQRSSPIGAIHAPFIRLFLAAILVLLVPKLAFAATISVAFPNDPNGTANVVVQGNLVESDVAEFRSKTGALSKAVVWFQSEGGGVLTGIEIGEAIRLKGFATFVPDGVLCASACAIAWLGGSPRYMATRARIGFHAAYNAASGQETGLGNALVGAYLTRIGLPYSAVIYITKASPNSMTWLSLADAKRQGIEVSLNSQQPEVSVKSQPKVIPKSEGPLPLSPQNFPTVGGYAIQVSSQRSSADAQAAYQVLQDRFPSILGRRQALIHKVDLGANGVFYRAMVGPFRTAEEALELCDSLKAAGGLCIVQKN